MGTHYRSKGTGSVRYRAERGGWEVVTPQVGQVNGRYLGLYETRKKAEAALNVWLSLSQTSTSSESSPPTAESC
jgi:hypothetical protein